MNSRIKIETVATADAAFAAAAASRGLLVWKAAFAVAVLVAAALVLPAQRSLREPPPPDTRIARLTMGLAPAERLGPADELGRPSRTAFAISPDGGTEGRRHHTGGDHRKPCWPSTLALGYACRGVQERGRQPGQRHLDV